MQQFYTIITDRGRAKLAKAIAESTQLMLKEFAIGEGNNSGNEPSETQINLTSEVYCSTINRQMIDENDNKNVVLELLIPENIGGWWIWEVGIYDSDNELFAIAKYPPTYKPSIADGTILKQLTIKFYLQVVNTENLTLDISNAGNIATIDYLESILPKAANIDETIAGNINNKYVTPKSLQAKKASANNYGLTKLATNEQAQAQIASDVTLTPANLAAINATQNDMDKGYSANKCISVQKMKIYNNKNKFKPSIWGVPQRDFVAFGGWGLRSNPPSPGDRHGICWSSELGLFCAVGTTWEDNNIRRGSIITSSNSINWTERATIDGDWRSICWSPELGIFCVVGNGNNNKVITSSDGINWVTGHVPSGEWFGVCWSPELAIFCAVGNNQVMTSFDGINWIEGIIPLAGDWCDICWSPELNIFCIVGGDNNVMTSPDGINWTARAVQSSNLRSICWSSELGIFCAVGRKKTITPLYTNSIIMTCPDGINWTVITPRVSNYLLSICWSPELRLFCATVSHSVDRDLMSADGINWEHGASSMMGGQNSMCWSPELGLFCGVSVVVKHSQSAWNYVYPG